MIGEVGLVREKMGHTGGNVTAYHCIIHQEALCVLGMEHVMTVVTKTVNFYDFMIPTLRSLALWKANKGSSLSLRMKSVRAT